MTKQEAAQLLDIIGGLWANYRPPNPIVAAESWASVLADVPLDLAAEALYALARRQREFPPDPGLVLDTIRELTGQRYPTPDEALAEVDREIRRVGYAGAQPERRIFTGGTWQAPEFPKWSCEPVRQAIEAVGYRDLCLATGEARSVIRSQFLRLYREIVDRAALHAAATPLTAPGHHLAGRPAIVALPSVVNE
jgi:hypothetical protein